MPERVTNPRFPTFQAGSFNNCTRAPALENWNNIGLIMRLKYMSISTIPGCYEFQITGQPEPVSRSFLLTGCSKLSVRKESSHPNPKIWMFAPWPAHIGGLMPQNRLPRTLDVDQTFGQYLWPQIQYYIWRDFVIDAFLINQITIGTVFVEHF